MAEWFLWLKVFHIVSVVAWMAGLFYLPRLFVYHCDVAPRSEASELFKTMERRLMAGHNEAGDDSECVVRSFAFCCGSV